MGGDERKLIEVPGAMPVLVRELRWFEQERGCRVVEIRVAAADFLSFCAMVTRRFEEFGEVEVRVDDEVRTGHVQLVGADLAQPEGCQRSLIAEITARHDGL